MIVFNSRRVGIDSGEKFPVAKNLTYDTTANVYHMQIGAKSRQHSGC